MNEISFANKVIINDAFLSLYGMVNYYQQTDMCPDRLSLEIGITENMNNLLNYKELDAIKPILEEIYKQWPESKEEENIGELPIEGNENKLIDLLIWIIAQTSVN